MKKYVFIILAAVMMRPDAARAAQAVSCVTQADFPKVCNTNQYCCASSDYMIKYSCPDGYTLSGTKCSRSASTGSDTTGNYTITYDTCDAQATQEKCCTVTTTNTNLCLQCIKL